LPLPKGLHFSVREKHWRNVARANLATHEYEVVGRWESVGSSVRGDAACERIEHLVAHVLQELDPSKNAGGRDTLYRDPADGRLWERTFPMRHLDGGGPPTLATISEEEAIEKYGRVARDHATHRHDDR